MVKDLTFTTRSWEDGSGTAASGWPGAMHFTITINSVIDKAYLCNVSDIFLSLDKTNNAFFIYYQNHKTYQYTVGDTYGGGAIADAEAMFNAVMLDITQ